MLKEDIWEQSSSKAGASTVTATGIEGPPAGTGTQSLEGEILSIPPLHTFKVTPSKWPKCSIQMLHLGNSSFSSNTQLCPEFVKGDEKEKGMQEGFGVQMELGCNECALERDSTRSTSTTEGISWAAPPENSLPVCNLTGKDDLYWKRMEQQLLVVDSELLSPKT